MADLVFPDHVHASLDHAPPSSQQDIVMTDAATETTTPERDQEGKPRYKIGESSSAAQVHPVTGEPICRTIPLILARLVRDDDTIDRLCDQLEEMFLDRMEVIEHDVEALQARVDDAEQKADILQFALEDAWAEIAELQTRSEDFKARESTVSDINKRTKTESNRTKPMKLSVDLNETKDSSTTDKASLNGKNIGILVSCRTPKSLTLEIHHGGWFTPTPSRSYIGGQVSSVNVVDIDEFCLHDLKDMVVKLGYAVEDLMYCNFLIPSLGLDYGLHSLNVDVDVLEMSKYVKDYKIILVYWEKVSSKSSSIGEVMKKLSKEHPASSMARPIVVESVVDPFDGLDEILEEEASDTEGNDTSGSDPEDLDYDPKHDDVFVDDEHIVEEVHVNMNNFSFTADPKHDISIGGVDVQDDDLDVIDYDSFGSDLDDGIDSERRIQLRELRRIGAKKQGWEVRTLIEDHTCIQSRSIKACTSRFLADHVIKSLVTNPDILVRAVQDQIYKEQYSLLREYAQELINQNPGTTIRIDVQQEPNPESLTRTFRRVYVYLGALKQCFRACGREILQFDGCFMSGPWPAIASVFPSAEHRYCVRHIHENMKSQFKGGVYKEMLWNAAKAASEGKFKRKIGELKSFNFDAYNWLMKIPLEQWSRAYFSGKAKCDLLINNICEVFNRQLVDGRDQPIITCLKYIKEYLTKRIVVVQKVIAKTVGPLTPSVTKMFDVIKKRLLSIMKWELTRILCKHVVAAIYNMSKNSVGVVVESRTVIIPLLYKPLISRPPKKRKKSNDEIASQSASSGKLSRKGKSVSCGKCGNVGHNRKDCRGQGGGSSQAGARKVSSQAVGSKKVSGQAAAARNVSGQAAGVRKASS
ncbi:mutator type transposase [Tanacetum coccineum]